VNAEELLIKLPFFLLEESKKEFLLPFFFFFWVGLVGVLFGSHTRVKLQFHHEFLTCRFGSYSV